MLFKQPFTQATILAYPQFGHTSTDFTLFTDASAVDLGAVLEQNGRVIAYASRVSCNSVCLQTISSLCVGSSFFADYRPCPIAVVGCLLKKWKALLCHWALAIREYNFTAKYHRGFLNDNADVLSCYLVINPCAAVLASSDQLPDLLAAQKANNFTSQLFHACLQSDSPPQKSHRWCQQPLQRYHQLWHQLKIVDGILCRKYSPVTCSDVVTVPILPESLIYQSHDLPITGHQGYKITPECLLGKHAMIL